MADLPVAETTGPRPLAISPLERAAGLVVGLEPGAPPLPPPVPGLSPRGALEAEVLDALRHPPCLVTFSGGRDSSAMLALATSVARKEGLALPLPVTLRFPLVDTSHEADWQAQVIRHLDLDDWVRLDLDDEIDCVGPLAREMFDRHGLLWPFNAHFLLLPLRAAAGGSLVTGIGGDEVLSPSDRLQTTLALTRRRPLRRRDFRRVLGAVAPTVVRKAVLRRQPAPGFPWLRPAADREYAGKLVAYDAAAPLRWDGQIRRHFWPSRYVQVARSSFAAMAAGEGTRVVHPFMEPSVLAAFAGDGGMVGFVSRDEAMRTLFGDLLPEDVLTRSSKAMFDGAFWNRHCREFASAWDGSGVDLDIVDPNALAATWATDPPDARSYLLLQSAWLGQRDRSGTGRG
ncbi:MAG: hypothetical protein QOG43_2505 [Actinomycetota bacterium]|nr:hypothetical protein [Actinomycetota bacterium]